MSDSRLQVLAKFATSRATRALAASRSSFPHLLHLDKRLPSGVTRREFFFANGAPVGLEQYFGILSEEELTALEAEVDALVESTAPCDR